MRVVETEKRILLIVQGAVLSKLRIIAHNIHYSSLNLLIDVGHSETYGLTEGWASEDNVLLHYKAYELESITITDLHVKMEGHDQNFPTIRY